MVGYDPFRAKEKVIHDYVTKINRESHIVQLEEPSMQPPFEVSKSELDTLVLNRAITIARSTLSEDEFTQQFVQSHDCSEPLLYLWDSSPAPTPLEQEMRHHAFTFVMAKKFKGHRILDIFLHRDNDLLPVISFLSEYSNPKRLKATNQDPLDFIRITTISAERVEICKSGSAQSPHRYLSKELRKRLLAEEMLSLYYLSFHNETEYAKERRWQPRKQWKGK